MQYHRRQQEDQSHYITINLTACLWIMKLWRCRLHGYLRLMCFETVDTNTHTWLRAAAGAEGRKVFKAGHSWISFLPSSFPLAFSYLSVWPSHRRSERERREKRERESLQTEGLTGCSPSELIITYMSEKPLCVLNKYNSTDDCSTHIHLWLRWKTNWKYIELHFWRGRLYSHQGRWSLT